MAERGTESEVKMHESTNLSKAQGEVRGLKTKVLLSRKTHEKDSEELRKHGRVGFITSLENVAETLTVSCFSEATGATEGQGLVKVNIVDW